MLSSNATSSPTPAASNTGSASSNQSGALGLAGNFNEFLQLLTTQLQHQDPTSPLDPNQFTQELVQFASVEQQINTNTSLTTMIQLQQSQQAASALQFIGATVEVAGTTAQLANGRAAWGYLVNQPATASISISNSAGQVVFSTTQAVQPGAQSFAWNGRDNQGNALPGGNYTIAISAVGSSNQNVPVTTQIQGVVTGVDVSKSPPSLTVNGQSFALNQITQVLSTGNGGK
jgi:flagellar basal-body rod modification protein FlgD